VPEEIAMIRSRRALLWLCTGFLVAGCAGMTQRDPVQVQVVGVEPLQGEGMELRFMTKLRVQNPNDSPIEYNGIFLDLQVQGSSLATGVSDAAGTLPRFGEVVLEVPVSVSALRLARQAYGFYTSNDRSRIEYLLKGKISGPTFSAVRFESKGELTLPPSVVAP
jgi:LEA14-like dessication related protein